MKDWARLAAVLLEAVGDHVAKQGRPTWVRVLDPPEGDPEEGFALSLSDESESFLGWVATPDCQAVGVVATGRLRSISGEPAPGGDERHDDNDHLRMACLLTRQGEVAWKTELPDGPWAAAVPEDAPTE